MAPVDCLQSEGKTWGQEKSKNEVIAHYVFIYT